MSGETIILLRRDCEAFVVPSGSPYVLTKATEVILTQSLGDSFTVNVSGNLFRIAGKDADALGREIVSPFANLLEDATLDDKVWALLKTCYDPEIPVNIVDLGLVYECHIEAMGNEKKSIHIKMTLTAPGCGMGPVLANDVKQKLLTLENIIDVNVEIVFDPPWSHSLMSDAAKLQLGIF